MMRGLLDDLLDLSKLEARRMRVEQIPFDLQLLIEDVALFWSAEAHAKGLSLDLQGAESLPVRAEGDPMRLRQILNNLISNALKFTDRGGVRIEASAAEAPGRTLRLAISVVDTGRGVDPERLARIFQPFDQGDASVARTHGGTGLGLAISRELARLMGGDLTAASRPGEGARFTMTAVLGRAGAAEVRPAPPPAPAAPPAPPAACILVVDDHEYGRRALSVLLGPLGVKVSLAEGGRQALELLMVERFDLVLMDVTMAGMDGLETCRALRARHGPNRRTPVVAVTGHAERTHLAACLAAGMNGWVAKPVEPAQLYAAIEKALSEGDEDAEALASA